MPSSPCFDQNAGLRFTPPVYRLSRLKREGTSSLPLMGMQPTFLGVTDFAIVTDSAHDVCLSPLFINSIAHGLTINSQTFIFHTSYSA